jgi:membrane-bound serine protease (ClpP class)
VQDDTEESGVTVTLDAFVSDPNLALLSVVIGIILLSWEIHAPGLFLPGAVGAVLTGLGFYGLLLASPTWYGSLLFLVSLLILIFELKTHTHVGLGVVGAGLLAWSTVILLKPPAHISPAFSIGLSLALGGITMLMGYLGLKAQSAKKVMGSEALIGQTGIVRSPLNPVGMILINGEYWQARSRQTIEAGREVQVRQVDNLVLEVEAR